MTEHPWPQFKLGLNPYGMTYHLGLQGRGTPRENPQGKGLEGFLSFAERLGAHSLELFDPWLQALSDEELLRLRDRLAEGGITPVISGGYITEESGHVFRSARLLEAETIRFALTNVLCGDRAFRPDWNDLRTQVEARIRELGPQAADAGRMIAIENHQDFTSSELVAFCQLTPGVGITYDTGNSFPVAESPLHFTKTVAPHVRHVQLKDYRVQFTTVGFRLARCAIGVGAVPFREIFEELGKYHDQLVAVLEPGALEARHVRLFTADWWEGYPEKSAPELAACLLAAQRNKFAADEDYQTPWELEADDQLEAYELEMYRHSFANMKKLGL
ncbi:MAG: sugar phosphate isomerase/epimerase family protein [bacterium]|jgi:sugar phosphate isomerase/epimerase